MKNCNLVIVSGIVVKEPQIVEGAYGPMANLSIEITETKRGKDGLQNETCRIQLSIMGSTAYKVKNMRLGLKHEVMAKGKLKLEQWKDKTTGQARFMHKIVVDDIWDVSGRLDLNDE